MNLCIDIINQFVFNMIDEPGISGIIYVVLIIVIDGETIFLYSLGVWWL